MTFSIIQKIRLEGALRLDAEYYCSPRLFNLTQFYGGVEIALKIQYGTSKELNEEKRGYPVLRLNEFEEYFSGTAEKYCELSKTESDGLMLKEGDVLICRTNGNPKLVGKAALVIDSKNQAFASYLFRVQTDESKINPETLVVFLNSKFGRSEIEKFLMPSIQSNFSPAQFREIKIPVFTTEIQKQLKDDLRASYQLLNKSKLIYSQAEDLLLEELGLKDAKTEENLSWTVNLADVKTAGRMDAEYFQPKYEKLILLLRKVEAQTLAQLAVESKGGVKADPKKLYHYSEISDVNTGNGEVVFSQIMGRDLPANAKNKVDGGELIISKVRPTRGAIAIVPEDWRHNHIVSGAFCVYRCGYPLREYLQVFLRSIAGKLQFEKPITGTSYPTVDDRDVRNLMIPILPKTIQMKIAELVRKSHEARKKSRQLLDEAKRRVEEFIERGS